MLATFLLMSYILIIVAKGFTLAPSVRELLPIDVARGLRFACAFFKRAEPDA